MTGPRGAVAAPAAELSEPLFAKLSPGPGRPATEVADHQRARVRRALVELSVERGYEAVTLRELVRRAGISTRAFYLHYAGKEECFLEAHELIARRLLRRLVASQVGIGDWRLRSRFAFRALMDELGSDPEAAQLLLSEAYAAGAVAVEQARRANRSLEARIGESFAQAQDRVVSPPIVEGMVAGALSVARPRVLSGRASELTGLGDRLADWALSYCSEAAGQLSRIDSISLERRSESHLRPASSGDSEGVVDGDCPGEPSGDLALLLSAATKLVASGGRGEGLTVRRILTAAGVPRRSFDAHFESAEDCLAAALELQVDEAVRSARRSSGSSVSWERGACQEILALCAEIASRPALADIGSESVAGESTGGVRWSERPALEIARLLSEGEPGERRPDQLAAEASANAVLSVLQTEMASTGGKRQLLCHAGTLAYLALAPTIGADEAIEVIREENDVATRR